MYQSLGDIIREKSKKQCRKLVLLGLLIAVLLTALSLILGLNLPALLRSPVDFQYASDARTGDYAAVRTAWLYDIDYTETETGDSGTKNTGRYGLIAYDDGFLVCLLPMSKADGLFESSYYGEEVPVNGWIREFSSHDKKLISTLISDIRRSDPGADISASDFSPYLLDAKQDFLLIHRLIAGAAALLTLLIIIRGLAWLRFLSNHQAHPVFKQIAKLGDADLLEQNLDMQMSSDRLIYRQKDLLIGQEITVFAGPKPWAHRTSDLIWVYKITTSHRYNGIPTGKTFALTMYFQKTIRKAPVPSDNEANNAVRTVMERLPSVLIGYEQELESLFRRDFALFEEKRREWTNSREQDEAPETEDAPYTAGQ